MIIGDSKKWSKKTIISIILPIILAVAIISLVIVNKLIYNERRDELGPVGAPSELLPILLKVKTGIIAVIFLVVIAILVMAVFFVVKTYPLLREKSPVWFEKVKNILAKGEVLTRATNQQKESNRLSEKKSAIENVYSFKKDYLRASLKYLAILGIFSIIFYCILHVFMNRFLTHRPDVWSDPAQPDVWSGLSKIFGKIIVIALLVVIAVMGMILLVKFLVLLVQKERIVLAKVVGIVEKEHSNVVAELDSQNASLAKTLAKRFRYVTIHQQAFEGSMQKVWLYASKIGYFRYPSASKVYNNLEGICQEVNLAIQQFSRKDLDDFLRFIQTDCQGGSLYFAGLVSVGEPAYQRINNDNSYSLDNLANSLVVHSRRAEIHSFCTIKQASRFKYRRRKRKSKKLANQKDKDNNKIEPTDEQKHFISETGMMRKSGYVLPEVAVLIKGKNRFDVENVTDVLEGSLGTTFDGFEREIEFKSVNPQRVIDRVGEFRLVVPSRKLIAGHSARAIIDVYRRPLSCVPLIKELTTPISMQRREATHPIVLGKTVTGEVIRATLDDYEHHRLIVGTTGYGKSEFIMAETEQFKEHYPEVKTLTLDFSGEYAKRFLLDEDTTVYEANSSEAPLLINPFEDEYVDFNEHIDFLFKYFCETLMLESAFDQYTPQMRRVLLGTLELLLSRENPDERNFASFEVDLDRFVEENTYRLNLGANSRNGILNRLSTLKRGVSNVVWVPKSNWSPAELEKRHQIINLRRIRNHKFKGAIVNLLLYKLRNYLVKKQPKGLKIIVYIEEAQLVAPELYRRGSAADLSFIEECLTEIRKWGVSITLIGTETDDITSKGRGTKFIINFGSHSPRLINPMNYPESMKSIHSLKKFQCDIKLPDEEFLFRAVKLPRPTREELSEEAYRSYLQTFPRYERLRAITSPSLLDDKFSKEKERREAVKALFTNCLGSCAFCFTEAKDCHLHKKKSTQLKAKLKEIADNVVRRLYGDWFSVTTAFENRFEEVEEEVRDLIAEILPPNTQIRKQKITEEGKEKLVRCVVASLLKGMILNEYLSLETALEFLNGDYSQTEAEQRMGIEGEYNFNGSEEEEEEEERQTGWELSFRGFIELIEGSEAS